MSLKPLSALVALGLATAANALTITASHEYQIEDKGAYTYQADSKFLDMGLNAGYKSFGVMDFSAAGLSGLVTSASLTMGDGSYSGSKATTVSLYAVFDVVTSLAKGQTTVGYDDSATGGYTGQLGKATLLGTYAFTPGAGSYTIPLTGDLYGMTTQIPWGSLRILATTDELGYATFGGVGTGTPGAPTLTITTQAVPEPSAFGGLLLGAVLIARRRTLRTKGVS